MATKKANKNKEVIIDFDNSIKAIKNTTDTLNKESKKAANKVMNDIKANAERISDYTTKTAKSAYSNTMNTVQKNATPENITATAKSINDMSLKIADSMVEGMMNNSEKWQKLAEKAMNNGMKISSKQQDMVLETLVDMKGQVAQGVDRLKKIFTSK